MLSKTPSIPAAYPLAANELPLVDAGAQTMNGYAWSPHGVKEVHYRINGGGWQEARIVPPNLGRYTWVRFEFPWDAPEGTHEIETRATDNNGDTQPETYPFNLLGMTNNAIPKFKLQAV